MLVFFVCLCVVVMSLLVDILLSDFGCRSLVPFINTNDLSSIPALNKAIRCISPRIWKSISRIITTLSLDRDQTLTQPPPKWICDTITTIRIHRLHFESPELSRYLAMFPSFVTLDLEDARYLEGPGDARPFADALNTLLSVIPNNLTELRLPCEDIHEPDDDWFHQVQIPSSVTSLCCYKLWNEGMFNLKSVKVSIAYYIHHRAIRYVHYVRYIGEMDIATIPCGPNLNLHTVVVENRGNAMIHMYQPHTIVHLRIAHGSSKFFTTQYASLETLEFHYIAAGTGMDDLTTVLDIISQGSTFDFVFGKTRCPKLTRFVFAIDFTKCGLADKIACGGTVRKQLRSQGEDWIMLEIRHATEDQSLESIFYEQSNEQLRQIALSHQS